MAELNIHRINDDHLRRLLPLWSAAFPYDPSDFAQGFLTNLPQDTIALTGECDGDLATMLFLLPAEARFRDEIYPVRYLYAGCTHPRYRGCGYYHELMAAAARVVAAMGENAIYLHPADDKLTETYKRFGYRAGIFRGSSPENRLQMPIGYASEAYLEKRRALTKRISDRTVYWNTDDSITRFFLTDAVARGAEMRMDDNGLCLSHNDMVIESINADLSREDKDYCLWLPIGDTPLTALMEQYDGITGLVGD